MFKRISLNRTKINRWQFALNTLYIYWNCITYCLLEFTSEFETRRSQYVDCITLYEKIEIRI